MYKISVEVHGGTTRKHTQVLRQETKGKELVETIVEAMCLADTLADQIIDRAPLMVGTVWFCYDIKPEVPREILRLAWDKAIHLLASIVTVLPETEGSPVHNGTLMADACSDRQKAGIPCSPRSEPWKDAMRERGKHASEG